MRQGFLKVAAACLPALLSGCLALGDVDRRATSFDQGVGSFQNRAILLNLARASLREPMYFVSVGATQGAGTEDFRASVPSFAEGPKLTSALHAFTFSPGGSTFLDNQTSTNTQMNVFSTHDFYQGLMTPLSLEEINLLLHQGYPRELIFYLTIAKAKITPLRDTDLKPDPDRKPYYIYNDPDGDPGDYQLFAGHIALAMEAGLTTDVSVESKIDGSGSSDKWIAEAPAPPKAKGGGVEFVLKAEAKPAQKVVECLDPALQSQDGRAMVATLQARHQPVRLCGEPEPETKKNVVFWPDRTYATGYQPQQIEIVFRSTYEIFRYLGALINEPRASTPTACPTEPEYQPLHTAPVICDYTALSLPGADRGPHLDPTLIGRLFEVEAGGGVANCFTAVSYSNRRFCVPNGGPDMTKDVFNILVSLVALKQSPGDLPTPQAVLLQ